MASVSAAPTRAVAPTSTVWVHAITRKGMDTNVRAARPIVQRASIAGAAVVPALAHARAAPTSQTMHTT